MVERAAFSERSNDYGHKREGQDPTYYSQSHRIGLSPEMFDKAIKELGDAEFACPETMGLDLDWQSARSLSVFTHNAAYMILEARTNLLPISRRCICSALKPLVMALLVPKIRTT